MRSNKWSFFASRPTSILNRQIRNNWYFNLAALTDLKVSQVLVIGDKGQAYVYVDKADDGNNQRLIVRDYRQHKIEENFKKFWKIIRKPIGHKINPVEQAINLHKQGSLLIYSHYVEPILTEKIQQLDNLSLEEKRRLRQLIRENTLIRDTFIKVLDRAFNQAYQYLKKKYPRQNLDNYLLEELLAGKKISQLESVKRKFFYVLLQQPKDSQLFTGASAKAILKKQRFIQSKIKSVNQFLGLVVCQGKAQGKVVVVRSLADLKNKAKNRIIVSPMTVPQFVPYLQQAKALVTDEGGINCHAAVVAREFNTPCIVGTKIATQVLKDGDFVEVDANKGIVRKLKK